MSSVPVDERIKNLDDLIEFAGRWCYNSTAKMGHAPNFIGKRIEEGHTDILEHAHFLFRVTFRDHYERVYADWWLTQPGVDWVMEMMEDLVLLVNLNARHIVRFQDELFIDAVRHLIPITLYGQ